MEGGGHLFSRTMRSPQLAPRAAPSISSKRNIRGGVGQDVGRIGNGNARGLGGGNVDMVGAHRECRNHADGGRQGIDDIRPALEHGGYQKCVKVLGLVRHFRSAYHAVL